MIVIRVVYFFTLYAAFSMILIEVSSYPLFLFSDIKQLFSMMSLLIKSALRFSFSLAATRPNLMQDRRAQSGESTASSAILHSKDRADGTSYIVQILL